jgi:hypothetical protein
MAMTKGGSVPNAGDSGYPAPTPHAAAVSHQVYEAPTSGAGVGAGEPGTDTNAGAKAGAALNRMTGQDDEVRDGNHSLGGGTAHAIEQPVMGDDSEAVYGAEHDQKGGNTGAAPLNYGGGTPKALDEMAGLQPGSGYGNVNEPVASPDKGLDPGATGYGSATGTGNQSEGPSRRIVKGEAKTDGGWQSL